MIVYTPIFYCAELKLAFKGKLTWKVADTLQYCVGVEERKVIVFSLSIKKYITLLCQNPQTISWFCSVRTCPALMPPQFGRLSTTTATVGTEVTVECEPGYIQEDGRIEYTLTCTRHLVWSDQVRNCTGRIEYTLTCTRGLVQGVGGW